jgi:hypothetical protein
MLGTKPTVLIVRDFRGSRLFLAEVTHGKGFRWISDSHKAMKFSAEEALAICERASREWGTQCAVLDTEGNLAQPKAATRTAVVSNEIAAANCRSILAQLSTDGKVNHKAFIGEMQSRSMEHYGKPLDEAQLRLLARIAAAYEAEQQS